MSCPSGLVPDVVPAPQDEAHHDPQASLEDTAKSRCRASPKKPIAEPEAPASALDQFYALSSKENKPPHNAMTPVKPRVCEDSAD